MERGVYVRPEVFELEVTDLFPRTWMFVCDTSEVAKPGDFVTTTIGHEPVVVLRDGDTIRAFSNVCTHRACLLLTEGGNCGRKIVCPYHGWSYGLDGRLTGVSYRSGFACEPDTDHLGLRELALGVWECFVFVNVSGDAPPLMEYLEDAPRLLAGHAVSAAKLIHSVDDEVAANWKILVDNAFCDYHIPFVHKRLMRSHQGISDFTESAGTYTNVLRSRLKPSATVGSGRPMETLLVGIFPNLVVIGFVNGDVHLLYWLPEGVDRSRALVRAYSHSDEERQGFEFAYGSQYVDDERKAIEQLQHEDYDICERVQRGMRSKYFHPGPRHYLETRVNGFQEKYLDLMRQLVDEDEPSAEIRRIGLNN